MPLDFADEEPDVDDEVVWIDGAGWRNLSELEAEQSSELHGSSSGPASSSTAAQDDVGWKPGTRPGRVQLKGSKATLKNMSRTSGLNITKRVDLSR